MFQPTNSAGEGNLVVYLSGDGTNGLTPVLAAPMNLTSLLDLGVSATAIVGFTAATTSLGLAASINSWTFSAVQHGNDRDHVYH